MPRRINVRWDDVMLSRRYNPLTAYKQSKLCDLLIAQGLNDNFSRWGVRGYAVDPGLVHTDIGNKDAGGLVDLIWKVRKRGGVSPEVPAETFVYLCTQTGLERQFGVTVAVKACDLTRPESVDALLAAFDESSLRFDMLLNIAHMGRRDRRLAVESRAEKVA